MSSVGTRPAKPPTHPARRLCAGAAALALLAPLPCPAGTDALKPTPLGEAEAVAMALAQPERVSLLARQRDLAEGGLAAAGLRPNPQVEFSREQVIRSPRDDINEFIWVTQDVDVANRRSLRRRAAASRLDATGADAAATRIEVAVRVRQRFYELLHGQVRAGEIADWQARLAGVASRVALREAVGEGAGYETLRIAREQAGLRTDIEREAVQVASAWSALETLCGAARLRERHDVVTGNLLPPAPPPLEGILALVGQRPDLLALQREADAAATERRLAGRAWIPDLTVGVGSKRVDDDLGRDSGPVVSLGLAVPLFDRGQVARQRAEAQAGIASASHDLALREAISEVRGAWSAYARLHEQSVERSAEVRQLSRTLVEVAEAGFLGGELTLVELLDAYRTEHGGRLQLLDLEAATRAAQLQLDRLTRLAAE